MPQLQRTALHWLRGNDTTGRGSPSFCPASSGSTLLSCRGSGICWRYAQQEVAAHLDGIVVGSSLFGAFSSVFFYLSFFFFFERERKDVILSKVANALC